MLGSTHACEGGIQQQDIAICYINVGDNCCNQEAACVDRSYPRRRDPASHEHSGAAPGPELTEVDHEEGHDLKLQATELLVASPSCAGKEYTLCAFVHRLLAVAVLEPCTDEHE
jgi:hypothetical protein